MKIKKRRSIIRKTLRHKNQDKDNKNAILKFVPFLMKHFAEYVFQNGFEAEDCYLKLVLSKPADKKLYNIIDLIVIFSCSQLKNIQLLWKLFLRIEVMKIIRKQIYSKRVQNQYSKKVDEFIENSEQKQTYKFYIKYQEGLNYNNPRYSRLIGLKDIRILPNQYSVDLIKFKSSVYRILANLNKQEIDNPKERLNNFLAIIDIVKHFNQIENFCINPRNVTDKLIWHKSSYDMTKYPSDKN
ncbi:hypothetical protein pb186bvf_010721 [Paramecium bursaria]